MVRTGNSVYCTTYDALPAGSRLCSRFEAHAGCRSSGCSHHSCQRTKEPVQLVNGRTVLGNWAYVDTPYCGNHCPGDWHPDTRTGGRSDGAFRCPSPYWHGHPPSVEDFPRREGVSIIIHTVMVTASMRIRICTHPRKADQSHMLSRTIRTPPLRSPQTKWPRFPTTRHASRSCRKRRPHASCCCDDSRVLGRRCLHCRLRHRIHRRYVRDEYAHRTPVLPH